MKPRSNALEKETICNEGEVFNLDIVAYKETYRTYIAMDFLNCGNFEETYKYPLGSLLFYPRHLVGHNTFSIFVKRSLTSI